MEYSESFKKLIEDPKRVRVLANNSFLNSKGFEQWKGARGLIANFINKDGTILDIGCSNGFLLRCLQEWSPYEIIPYGIDCNKGLVWKARELFPMQKENFIFKLFAHIDELPEAGFPERFDFIYWNVWDNYDVTGTKELDQIKTVLNLVNSGGRLILGFYGSNRENNFKKIKSLEKEGYNFSKISENHYGDGCVIACIDK